MDKTKFINFVMRAQSVPTAGLEPCNIYGPWPLLQRNASTRTHYVAYGYVVHIRDTNLGVGENEFAVTVSCSVDASTNRVEYYLGCPNTTLFSGTGSMSGYLTVCDNLDVDQEQLRESIQTLFGILPQGGACNFTELMRREELCEHVAMALNEVDAMENGYLADALEELARGARKQAQTQEKGAPVLKAILKYSKHVPILLEGDRGAGKTFIAREIARQYGVTPVELAGHEGVEALDILGYTVNAGVHGFVWKDGPVTRAFRQAQSQKTVLLLDELLRIPQRQLSALLTAFTPDEVAGVYRISTGRVLDVVDGVAQEETLTCPIENLCVIATTNVGAEYAVDEADPALRERFHVIRFDTDVERLREILAGMFTKKGWSVAGVPCLIDFFTAMNVQAQNGMLAATPSTRLLARAVSISKSPRDVGPTLKDFALQWAGRDEDGRPNPEHLKTISELINLKLAKLV